MDISAFFSRVYARLTAQPVLWLFAITLAVVAAINPMRIGLLFWGICKLACFGFAGAWLFDRLFRKYSPDEPGVIEGTLWKLKALIVAASIVAGALLP